MKGSKLTCPGKMSKMLTYKEKLDMFDRFALRPIRQNLNMDLVESEPDIQERYVRRFIRSGSDFTAVNTSGGASVSSVRPHAAHPARISEFEDSTATIQENGNGINEIKDLIESSKRNTAPPGSHVDSKTKSLSAAEKAHCSVRSKTKNKLHWPVRFVRQLHHILRSRISRIFSAASNNWPSDDRQACHLISCDHLDTRSDIPLLSDARRNGNSAQFSSIPASAALENYACAETLLYASCPELFSDDIQAGEFARENKGYDETDEQRAGSVPPSQYHMMIMGNSSSSDTSNCSDKSASAAWKRTRARKVRSKNAASCAPSYVCAGRIDDEVRGAHSPDGARSPRGSSPRDSEVGEFLYALKGNGVI